MNESEAKKGIKCSKCGLVDWVADGSSCQRCGAPLIDTQGRENVAYIEAEDKDNRSRIHQWDSFAFKRALLWALLMEAIFVGVFTLTPAHTGSVNPHNPPPLSLCCLGIVYLPAAIIFPHNTFGYIPMVVFHSILVTYILFVRYRLKNIRSLGR
jgi:hypothetical protein